MLASPGNDPEGRIFYQRRTSMMDSFSCIPFNFQTFILIIAIALIPEYGPRQANLVLIAYASSEGSGEPAHPRSLARTFAARS